MSNNLYLGYVWLVVAGVLVALELTIGSPSFVLLIFGGAAAIGAVSAFLGAPVALQLFTVAVTAVVSYFFLRRMKKFDHLRPTLALDIGAPVTLAEKINANEAKVTYRGTAWIARTDDADIDWNAPLFIKEIRGTTLIVRSVKK